MRIGWGRMRMGVGGGVGRGDGPQFNNSFSRGAVYTISIDFHGHPFHGNNNYTPQMCFNVFMYCHIPIMIISCPSYLKLKCINIANK